MKGRREIGSVHHQSCLSSHGQKDPISKRPAGILLNAITLPIMIHSSAALLMSQK
ncbi:hypothetical protein RE6C_03308 [Rhodopirellula europaea 6C]|jgi:hypothetical protein|uniref:Uncharacterized protein n=1 Tax=Rhodopirellula europaea 6C TaxID=1263867 RepID=M2A636_9BACT|nr:hypothetical protein RE6C_03308 [Rhodopirellula europaea 6C]